MRLYGKATWTLTQRQSSVVYLYIYTAHALCAMIIIYYRTLLEVCLIQSVLCGVPLPCWEKNELLLWRCLFCVQCQCFGKVRGSGGRGLMGWPRLVNQMTSRCLVRINADDKYVSINCTAEMRIDGMETAGKKCQGQRVILFTAIEADIDIV